MLSAAKSAIPLEEAASVVTVITREDILRAGYRSIADAIQSVPGVYLIQDHLKSNFGVRGVNAGTRAWSSVVKALIDGQPVSFRPDTSNNLAVELIPIESVQQIQVIRGPVSALYGANAFLGVVNIVTRSPQEAGGVSAGGWFGQIGTHPGGGWSAAMGGDDGRLKTLVTVAGQRIDRSGLELPGGLRSTNASRRSEAPVSLLDDALALSFFERVSYDVHSDLRVSFDGLYSYLDSGAEWQDWAPLSHRSRFVESNAFIRGTADLSLGDYSLRFSSIVVPLSKILIGWIAMTFMKTRKGTGRTGNGSRSPSGRARSPDRWALRRSRTQNALSSYD